MRHLPRALSGEGVAPAESACHIESAVFADRPPGISANTPSAVTEGRGGQVCFPDITFCPLPFLHPAPLKKPSGLRSKHSVFPRGLTPSTPRPRAARSQQSPPHPAFLSPLFLWVRECVLDAAGHLAP